MRPHRVVLAAVAAFFISAAPAQAAHHRHHAHHHAQRHPPAPPTNIFHRTWRWLMSIRDDIAAYARQHGLDPAYALAVAERESSFNPNAHASKTIHGLFQMSGAERERLGIPLTTDVGTQTEGFARYTNGLRQDMANRLGRDPSPSELYLGHYWGAGRAAGVITGHYSGLRARDVFTPRELAENPNLKPDKPVEDIATGIENDMAHRYAKFGGQGASNNDFDRSAYGVPVGDTAGDTTTAAADGADAKSPAFDPSIYMTPPASTDNPTVKTAMSPDDLSQTPPNSGAPEPKMASISKPSAPLSLTPAPSAPSLPSAPSAPSADDQAMTTAALNDTGGGGLGDFADAFSDIGKSMSAAQQQAPATAMPKLNLGDDVLQRMALAQQAEQPVSGLPSIPGGHGTAALPGQNQQAPSYLDPRMFGIQPTQQG